MEAMSDSNLTILPDARHWKVWYLADGVAKHIGALPFSFYLHDSWKLPEEALHQLGRTDEARDVLERLRIQIKAMNMPPRAMRLFREFQREAEELLGASK